MRLGKTYSIDNANVNFTFTPYHKFNFLIDDSGTGKTTMLKELGYSGGPNGFLLWYGAGSIISLTSPIDHLIIFDEDQIIQFITTYGVDVLNQSDNVFLIVGRELIDFTSIDYRAIYTLISNGRRYTAVRKYDYYTTFVKSTNILVDRGR